MNAYKFLRPGRIGPFSGFEWPEASWVDADGPPELCRSGVHACSRDQLAYWLAEELWEVELDGELVETDLQVIATRGRLLRRVEAWDEQTSSEFAAECVRHTAGYAAAELREQGVAAEADRLGQALGLEEMAARAEAASEAAGEVVGAGDAVDLAGYVVDAVGYAKAGQTAGAAFVAAHAADVHSPPGVDDPFTAEREAQAGWLVERLRLSADDG